MRGAKVFDHDSEDHPDLIAIEGDDVTLLTPAAAKARLAEKQREAQAPKDSTAVLDAGAAKDEQSA